MARLLTALIALATLGGLAYWAMYRQNPLSAPAASSAVHDEPSAPKQQLDNVRRAATRIEQNDQQYVNDAEAKTSEH